MRINPTVAGLFVVVCGLASLAVAAEPRALPDYKTVQSAMSKYLAKQREYKPGDLITRNQISGVLEAVEKSTGWKLSEAQHDELVKRGVEDRSFLAKQLTTKSGREFSRHISRYKLGFDQLDRLSTMPQGRSTVERLAKGPDGYKLLEYMATANGGHELAKMLSNAAPRGTNFEAATGKIYDEMQLDTALEKLHQAAQKKGSARPASR